MIVVFGRSVGGRRRLRSKPSTVATPSNPTTQTKSTEHGAEEHARCSNTSCWKQEGQNVSDDKILGRRLRSKPSTAATLSSSLSLLRGSRRWSLNPSGTCLYERPTRGRVCGTMRSMCGADAGCLAIKYQSLCCAGALDAYRGTSLIRNFFLPGSYSRRMPSALQWPHGWDSFL